MFFRVARWPMVQKSIEKPALSLNYPLSLHGIAGERWDDITTADLATGTLFPENQLFKANWLLVGGKGVSPCLSACLLELVRLINRRQTLQKKPSILDFIYSNLVQICKSIGQN
jgi:hypothetical protein